MNKIETHPHEIFMPARASVMIIGSFPGRGHTEKDNKEWYYESKRNQFWKIIGAVYQRDLSDVHKKQQLFAEKGIAIGDLFYKVIRKKENNSDSSLQVIAYHDKALSLIFKKNNFEKILFTSKFVEREFRKLFPAIENIATLPSPSPRVATISIAEKIEVYRLVLPG